MLLMRQEIKSAYNLHMEETKNMDNNIVIA